MLWFLMVAKTPVDTTFRFLPPIRAVVIQWNVGDIRVVGGETDIAFVTIQAQDSFPPYRVEMHKGTLWVVAEESKEKWGIGIGDVLQWIFGGRKRKKSQEEVELGLRIPSIPLQIKLGVGDVEIHKIPQIRSEVGVGDVIIQKAHQAEVKVGVGDLQASHVDSIRANLGVGDGTLENVCGWEVETGVGSITIQCPHCQVGHAETGVGSVSIQETCP